MAFLSSNEQIQDGFNLLNEELNECGLQEGEGEDLVDLAENRDAVLSELWDMTTEDTVAKELCQAEFLRVVKLLLDEILVGIVGNLVCHKPLLAEVNDNIPLRDSLIRLLTSRDIGVLVETLRLLKTIASVDYVSWQQHWESSFLEDGGLESLVSILSSSTNALVLAKAAEFLEILLNEDSSVQRLETIGYSRALLPAILEAIQQCMKDQSVPVCVSLLHCLQEMTTTEWGLSMLGSDVAGVISATTSCVANISLVADFEFIEPAEIFPLVYALSVWNCLLTDDCCYETLLSEEQMLKGTLCLCDRFERCVDDNRNGVIVDLLCKEFQSFLETLRREMTVRDPPRLEMFPTDLPTKLKNFFSFRQ